MKIGYEKFVENVIFVHNSIIKGKVPQDLSCCLEDKKVKSQSKILKNIVLILSYIINNPVLAESFLEEGHVAERVERKKTRSLFPFQVIRNKKNEFQLVISYKRKISNWYVEGKVKTVKEALIFFIYNSYIRWFKGVDAVIKGEKINSAEHEIKLSHLINSNYIHQITEGKN